MKNLLKRILFKLRIQLIGTYRLDTSLFIKLRKILNLEKIVREFKKEYFKKIQENRKVKIDIKEIGFNNFKDIHNSNNYHLDKIKEGIIILPDRFAYETWYLEEKKNYSQGKIEEDILRHGSEYEINILIKTRSYGLIKQIIRETNCINWRGKLENNHFNDFNGERFDLVTSILRKKLFKQRIKDILKDIFYFGFPRDFSSQIIN